MSDFKELHIVVRRRKSFGEPDNEFEKLIRALTQDWLRTEGVYVEFKAAPQAQDAQGSESNGKGCS